MKADKLGDSLIGSGGRFHSDTTKRETILFVASGINFKPRMAENQFSKPKIKWSTLSTFIYVPQTRIPKTNGIWSHEFIPGNIGNEPNQCVKDNPTSSECLGVERRIRLTAVVQLS